MFARDAQGCIDAPQMREAIACGFFDATAKAIAIKFFTAKDW